MPTPIRWTPQLVAAYWDWAATAPGPKGNCFSRTHGHDVLRQVRSMSALPTPVLDLGAAAGDFTAHLLDAKLDTVAADVSSGALTAITERFAANPRFRGVVNAGPPIVLPDESVGTVCAIETIEHVLDEDLPAFLAEIRRVLHAGGRVVITTPLSEDLEAQQVMCPNCSTSFHRWQHVRSLSPSALDRLMAGAGFETVVCRPAYWSGLRGLHRRIHEMRRRWEGVPENGLLYIGRVI
jgi:cyclopropane fatty-acyl-phospholipid synthase-like methyltransferase